MCKAMYRQPQNNKIFHLRLKALRSDSEVPLVISLTKYVRRDAMCIRAPILAESRNRTTIILTKLRGGDLIVSRSFTVFHAIICGIKMLARIYYAIEHCEYRKFS